MPRGSLPGRYTTNTLYTESATKQADGDVPRGVVFVEGFLIFASQEVMQLLDKRVLVLIGQAEARKRRYAHLHT